VAAPYSVMMIGLPSLHCLLLTGPVPSGVTAASFPHLLDTTGFFGA
jgi:hypothetical protein